MANESLREKFPEILNDFLEVALVYLFGSQVSRITGPLRDYDLAILDEGPTGDVALQTRFQFALSRVLGTDRVDVILLNRAPVELAFEIISSGVLLYQKDLFPHVEYEATVMSLYGDYLPYMVRREDGTGG